MWICSKCRSKVDDDFDICWKCQTDREGKRPEPPEKPDNELVDENSRQQPDEAAARTFLSIAYMVTGALCGAVIGYLIGPTIPFDGGHLPLETVLTGGSDLHGPADLLSNMAQDASVKFWVFTLIGAVAGFIIGKLRNPQKTSSLQPGEKITVLASGAILVTEEPPPDPPCIELGQTVDQVQSVLNEQPKTIVKLKDKQVYVFTDMKITFVNGRVADVET